VPTERDEWFGAEVQNGKGLWIGMAEVVSIELFAEGGQVVETPQSELAATVVRSAENPGESHADRSLAIGDIEAEAESNGATPFSVALWSRAMETRRDFVERLRYGAPLNSAKSPVAPPPTSGADRIAKKPGSTTS